MPTVDFTLEDLKKVFVTRDEFDDRVRGVVREQICAEVPAMIEGALVGEREYTQQMMAEAFMNFWDSNLGPAFDELHGEFAQLKSRLSRLEREVRA